MWTDPGNIENRSQIHECGNWDRGRAILFLEIYKWDFHCSVWAETTPAYDGPVCVGGGWEEGAQQPLQLVLCVLPTMSDRSTEQVLDSLHATEVIAKSLKGLAIN